MTTKRTITITAPPRAPYTATIDDNLPQRDADKLLEILLENPPSIPCFTEYLEDGVSVYQAETH